MPRRSLLVTFGVMFLCLALVTACKKKPAETGAEPPADPGAPPAAVKSDYLLFAQLNAKQIRDGAVFTELKQAVTKAAGAAGWDLVEGQVSRETGIKPTDVDAVTVCVLDISERGEPRFILLLAANKSLPKTGAFGIRPGTKPDARGFYQLDRETAAHFPDDKTLAVMHTELTQKYLDGYAKDRTGWPLTADLSRAASGHTLFALVQGDKLPEEARNGRGAGDLAPLLAAKTVTVTADLRGKELSLAARATFPDAAAAGRAKDKGREFIKLATDEVTRATKTQTATDLGPLLPVVKEAERALTAAKLEAAGPDLTLAAGYKADFDLETMIADAVPKVREAAARTSSQNNLKQIVLALHNHEGAIGWFPVHGVGPKGAQPKATDKPLLSWRVALLPYIEEDNLYRQFKLDEPWDSANNKKLIEKMPKAFAPVNKPGKAGYTHLQMVVGPNAMSPTISRFTSITDGTSNTIAVVEAADPVVWTKPDDVMLPGKVLPKDLKKKFGGQFKGGFNVAMWDGSVRFVADTVSDKALAAALSPAGGEVLDW